MGLAFEGALPLRRRSGPCHKKRRAAFASWSALQTGASGLTGGGEAGKAKEPFFACKLPNDAPLPPAADLG